MSKLIDLVRARPICRATNLVLAIGGTIDVIELVESDIRGVSRRTIIDVVKLAEIYLLELLLKFPEATIIMFNLFPRSYCIKGCEDEKSCKYVHFNQSNRVQKRLERLNRYCKSFNWHFKDAAKFDTRFQRVLFYDVFRFFQCKGTFFDSYGGFLAKDGLHLSPQGKEFMSSDLTRLAWRQ